MPAIWMRIKKVTYDLFHFCSCWFARLWIFTYLVKTLVVEICTYKTSEYNTQIPRALKLRKEEIQALWRINA